MLTSSSSQSNWGEGVSSTSHAEMFPAAVILWAECLNKRSCFHSPLTLDIESVIPSVCSSLQLHCEFELD